MPDESLGRGRRISSNGLRNGATAPVKEFLVEQKADLGVPENDSNNKDRGVTEVVGEVSESAGVDSEPAIPTTEFKNAVDEKKRKRNEPDDAPAEPKKADTTRPTPKRISRAASRTSPPPSPQHGRKASRELQGLGYGFKWAK